MYESRGLFYYEQLLFNYFKQMFWNKRFLNFDNSDSQCLGNFFILIRTKWNINTYLLSRCNFSNFYCISQYILKRVFSKCENFTELHLAETALTIQKIAIIILLKWKKLLSFSLNLRAGDWKFSLLDVPKLVEALKKLKSLELVLTLYCNISEKIYFLK